MSAEAGTESEEEKPHTSTHSSQDDSGPSQAGRFDVDTVEPIAMLQQQQQEGGSGNSSNNQNINPLEALLGGNAGFPPILDIPSDADDETMVELAIALSLQEHELGGESSAQQAMHGLQVCIFLVEKRLEATLKLGFKVNINFLCCLRSCTYKEIVN